MTAVPLPLDFPPGISRDGTMLDNQSAVDAQWCRFRIKRPRKMGGFRAVFDAGHTSGMLLPVPRRMHVFYQGSNTYVHVAGTGGIQQIILDQQGNFVSLANRTPAAGFSPNPAAQWTLDSVYDTITGKVQLVAHSAPNANTLASTIQTVPFLGDIATTTPLVQFSAPGSLGGGTYSAPNLAGGIASVQPYLFGFDANGLVQWSAPNIPLALGVTGGTSGAGQARPSAQKLVACQPLRSAGTQQPALLLWSLSELIFGNFVGSSAGIFSFSTVSPSVSILSNGCVIEDGGLVFWVGTDRFYVYNGTVNEIPNPFNQDWFFDNLNWDYVGKVQAYKVPRYGEIWWLAPMFGNTECSHAIIFNKRENCWYDTVLPNGGRACGFFAQGLRYPMMAGTTIEANGMSRLWLHEYGVDQVDDSTAPSISSAVRSYFETPFFGGPKNQTPSDKGVSIQQLEPDLIQAGDMTVYVIGTANARAPENTGTPEALKAVPAVPQEQFVSFKESHRLARLHVESNVVGGNYVTGRNLLHADEAEARKIS